MLVIAKITQGAAGGYADYLEGKVQPSGLGDYYLKDGERAEAPGRWVTGASVVGCDTRERVTGGQLRALMAVKRPDNGHVLRRAGSTGEAVSAIDATFSAPKSVSAIWALADGELRAQIELAHEHAVDRAVGYAVRQVPMIRQRTGPDQVLHEKATGVVATSWRHTTARAVDDRPPDPQLHSHVLLHAAVRRDGRVVAIDSRSWLQHQRELGAAYRTELARELTGLGYPIRRGTGRGARYFEIAGIPQALLDRWSGRHAQVRAAIENRLHDQQAMLLARIDRDGPDAQDAVQELGELVRTGMLSPKEDRSIGTITRTARQPVTVEDLNASWREDATALGFHSSFLARVPPSLAPPLQPASVGRVLDGLTEFDATFAARDARAVALETSAGVPIDTALRSLRALRADGEIVRLTDGTGTTREHRERERGTIRTARQLTAEPAGNNNAERPTGPIPELIVAREADRLDRELQDRGGRLSGEQRHAIETACGEQRLVVIEGQAGTGKSTTLTGIARAHQADARQIIVTSTAALAAERLARELHAADVHADAYSTSSLHAALQTGRLRLTSAHTIIHDEAALASTREQQHLLDAVHESGARLIAVGDPAQNQAVGAGGLWPHIEHVARAADGHVELTVNQRARDPNDRHDQRSFRAGDAEQALRGYDARGRLHHLPDQARAEDHALDAAHHDRTHGLSTIVIAQTSNDRLDELNARAQAIRRQHGELGSEAFPVPRRPYQLHVGDHIQIRHTIPYPHEPDKHLRNGTTATITTATPDALRLLLADRSHVTLYRSDADAADLRLAYVQHPFPAQGVTTDTAHLIVAEHPTREGTYVAITRARNTTHIHATTIAAHEDDNADDPIIRLAERLSRTEPDIPSINTPLAHEHAITQQPDAPWRTLTESPNIDTTPTITTSHTDSPRPANADLEADRPTANEREPGRENAASRDRIDDLANEPGLTQQPGRTWPRSQPRHPDRTTSLGWEP